MRVGGAAHVHVIGPTLALGGPGADERAHVRIRGPRLEFAGLRTEAGAAAGRTQTEARTEAGAAAGRTQTEAGTGG